MKFEEVQYLNNQKSIIKFPDHYVAMAIMFDDEGIVANADGKKIVPAGTIIGGTGGVNAILADVTIKATKHNTQAGVTGAAGAAVDAEGVLFSDVDVTAGDAAGTMLIHGFVDLNKLPEAPSAAAVTALAGRILFIK